VSLKKGGAGAFDAEFLRSQKDAILKGLNNMDEELEQLNLKKEESKDPFENKSLAEVLREKREATDKILEKTKVDQ
jgi:hypothetical protein